MNKPKTNKEYLQEAFELLQHAESILEYLYEQHANVLEVNQKVKTIADVVVHSNIPSGSTELVKDGPITMTAGSLGVITRVTASGKYTVRFVLDNGDEQFQSFGLMSKDQLEPYDGPE